MGGKKYVGQVIAFNIGLSFFIWAFILLYISRKSMKEQGEGDLLVMYPYGLYQFLRWKDVSKIIFVTICFLFYSILSTIGLLSIFF